MLAAFAEFERDTIRDRHMSGRHLAAKSGKGWGSGAPPYGYLLNADGYLSIREDEAEIVRTMFEMRSIGMTLREIARHLNEKGVEPRTRYSRATGDKIVQGFGSGSVHAYLKATYYKGADIVRKIAPAFGQPPEAFAYPVPAIVHEVLWARANK
jgi:hypothetical protein